jgi:hypothetical protein
MPYKDAERRRAFDRGRKRRRRADQKKMEALASIRLYYSSKFPCLYVNGAGGFIGGFLLVRDQAAQGRVEEHHEFGVSVFPVQLDLSCLLKILPK